METREDTVELREVLKVLHARWGMIAALTLGAAAAGLAASLLMAPVYRASTSIMIRGQSALSNPLLEAFQTGTSAASDYVELLRSRSLLFAASRRLGLVSDENDPVMGALRNAVKVQAAAQSNLILVQVESEKPVQARDLANELATELMNRNREDNSLEAKGAREFIGGQLEEVSEQLKKAEQALQKYEEANGVFDPRKEAEAVIERIARLEAMNYETAVALRENEARTSKLGEAGAEDLTPSPAVQALKGKLAEVETALAGAREKYTDKHPQVMELVAQSEALKQRIAAEVTGGLSQNVAGLKVEAWVLRERQKAISRLLGDAQRDFQRFPEKERRIGELMRDAKVQEQIYLMLREKYEEARITEASQSAGVKVVDRALTPLKPVRPRKALNVAAAALLGLFAGVGGAFILEYLDTTIRGGREAEELLGLPVLGRIPSFGQKPGNTPGK